MRVPVRKYSAQIQRRMRPALFAGGFSQMQVAATHTVVVRRQHLLHDLRNFGGTLLLLEAEGGCNVAGELAGGVGVGVDHLRFFNY